MAQHDTRPRYGAPQPCYTLAMPAPFTWTLPYPSQRSPVLARNCVATTQPLAAQAGLQMLRMGGNAVDAAVATAACMTVLEPINNALGSDNFALVWDGKKVHGLNASGRSPKALTAAKFGKLPFEKLMEPAIGYAERGFHVAPRTAAGWVTSVKRFKDFPEWQKVFAPKGRSPEPGELFSNPDQAKTLRRIAETKGEA